MFKRMGLSNCNGHHKTFLAPSMTVVEKLVLYEKSLGNIYGFIVRWARCTGIYKFPKNHEIGMHGN